MTEARAAVLVEPGRPAPYASSRPLEIADLHTGRAVRRLITFG